MFLSSQISSEFLFETTEQIPHQRGKFWIIGLGVGVLIGVLLSILQSSISLGILSVVIGIVYLQSKNTPPKTITVHITNEGILINKTFYTYQECNIFWIVWKPFELCMLHLLVNNKKKEIYFPISPLIKDKIKNLLKERIEEDASATERNHDKIARILKL